MIRFVPFLCAALLLIAWAGNDESRADDQKLQPTAVAPIAIAKVNRAAPIDFQVDIKPMLDRNCVACHHGAKAAGKLSLDSAAALLLGGETGPVVIAGKGEESLLVRAAAHLEEPHMPPTDNKVKAVALTSEELGLLKLWIDQGAKGAVNTAKLEQWRSPTGAQQSVMAVAADNAGNIIAGSRLNQIDIYNLAAKRRITRLVDPSVAQVIGVPAAHIDVVQALAVNAAGTRIASGGFREIKIWERPQDVRIADLPAVADAAGAVTISLDNTRVAIGESSGAIGVYDLAAHKRVATLKGASGAIAAAIWSFDGKLLYVVSGDNKLREFSVADGKVLQQLDLPKPATSLALVAGGAQLAISTAEGLIDIYARDAIGKKPAPLKTLKGHNGAIVRLIAVDAGGTTLASAGADKTVRLWTVADGKQQRQLDHPAVVADIACAADKKLLATVAADGKLRLWNSESGAMVAESSGAPQAAWRLAEADRQILFAQARIAAEQIEFKEAETAAQKEKDALAKLQTDRKVIHTTLVEKTAAFDKTKQAQEQNTKDIAAAEATLKTLPAQVAEVEAALAKAPNNLFLTKARDEAKKQLDETNQKLTAAKAAKPAADTALTTATTESDAAKKAVESSDRSQQSAAQAIKAAEQSLAKVRAAEGAAQANNKRRVEEQAAAKKAQTDSVRPLRAVAFSADGTQVAAAGETSLIEIYDTVKLAPLETIHSSAPPTLALRFVGADRVLAVAPKSTSLWNSAPQWVLARTIGNVDDPSKLADRVTALDFSGDGKLLVSGGGEPSRGGEVKIWNPADGALIRTINGAHSDTVYAAHFSPESNLLATGSADRFARIFEVATGKLVLSCEGHSGHVLSVAWRGDSKWLATSSSDFSIKVWNTVTAEQIRTQAVCKHEITSVHFVQQTPATTCTCGDPCAHRFTAEGADEHHYPGVAEFMQCACHTAFGTAMIGGSQDGMIFGWDIATKEMLLADVAPPLPTPPPK